MVWEDEKLMIHCPNSYYIQIVYAYYGFGVCRSSVADEIVKVNCEGMMRCKMIVDEITFGQQCTPLKKYLEVTYTCIKEISSKRIKHTFAKIFYLVGRLEN